MSVKVTIQGLSTYRFSGETIEGTYCFEGRLIAMPAIDAIARIASSGNQVREVRFSAHNSDFLIPIATDPLWNAIVTVEIVGVSDIWIGRLKSWQQSAEGIIDITAAEDSLAVLQLYLPDEVLSVGSWTGIEATWSNKAIPMIFGGTDADGIRVPGMMVDASTFTFIFCVGEIQGLIRLWKDNAEITTGFTFYTGAAAQANYPGIVYVTFAADPRDDAGRWPDIVAEIKGLKLGAATNDQCRNPARILQYILTTTSSGPCGWGLGVAVASLDAASFAQAITDCDTAGFKLDGAINAQNRAKYWLDMIALGCRGTLAFIAGKWTLNIDKGGASAKTFTADNMALKSFGRGASSSRINRVRCNYRFRYSQQGGKMVGYAQRDDATSQAAIGVNEISFDLPLVSDHATAGAIADYALRSSAYAEKKIAFTAMDFSGISVGSVVTIIRSDLGLAAELFKIFKLTNNEFTAEIEAAGYSADIFGVEAIGTIPADPIITQLHAGPSIALPPDVITGFTLTSSAQVRTDGTLHVWIDGTFTKGRNYLMGEIQVSDDAGATWNTLGTTTNNSFRHGPVNPGHAYKFRVIATGTGGQAAPVEADVTAAGSVGPADVSALTLTQDLLDLTKINFSWPPVNDRDLSYYEIREGLSWGISPIVGNQVKERTFSLNKSANGTYNFLIRAVDRSGVLSTNPASSSIVLAIYPSDVAGFLASQNGDKALLTWAPVADIDLRGYEIREGSTWDSGTVVADTVTDMSIQLDVNFERKYSFWIKAKTSRKAYSQTAANSQIVISNLLPKNYIVTKDEIATPTGTHFQTEIGSPFWTFDNMPGTFDDYPGLTFEDFPSDNVLKLKKTGAPPLAAPVDYDEIATPTGIHAQSAFAMTGYVFDTMEGAFDDYTGNALTFDDFPKGSVFKLALNGTEFYPSGYYTATFDMGSWVSADIMCDWEKFVLPSAGSATLEFRYSNDGITWTAWEVYSACSKAFRYIQFRLGLSTSDLAKSPEVTKFHVYFTAPSVINQTYYDTGYYTVSYDIGAATTCDVAVDSFLFILPPGVSADLEYRYSVDGVTWSTWAAFVPSKKTFRYIEFRMLLATTDSTLTPEVTRFAIKIDVPDIDQKGTKVVDVAGSAILFPQPYNLVPALVVTAEGSDVKADYYSVTNTGFTVRNYKRSDGSAIGGMTVNWISKGY